MAVKISGPTSIPLPEKFTTIGGGKRVAFDSYYNNIDYYFVTIWSCWKNATRPERDPHFFFFWKVYGENCWSSPTAQVYYCAIGWKFSKAQTTNVIVRGVVQAAYNRVLCCAGRDKYITRNKKKTIEVIQRGVTKLLPTQPVVGLLLGPSCRVIEKAGLLLNDAAELVATAETIDDSQLLLGGKK